MAPNIGGESHTFTEVQALGGGCILSLNPAGTTPVPECQIPFVIQTTSVAAGGELTLAGFSPGVHRFMCLLHP